MAEVQIRPLLAHIPERTPPRRWGALFLPLAMALIGIFIATGAADLGSRQQRRLEENQIDSAVPLAAAQLKAAQTALGPIQKKLADDNRRLQLNFDWTLSGECDQLAAQQRALENTIAQCQAQLNAAKAPFGFDQGISSYRRPGRALTNWDGYRYEEIIDNGYVFDRQSPDGKVVDPRTAELRLTNVSWYPLFPLIGSITRAATGLPAIFHYSPSQNGRLYDYLFAHGITTATALTFDSRLFSLAGAIMVFAFARRHFHNRIPALELDASEHITRQWDLNPADTAALWTVTFLFFNPAAIFLYANFTESLFVLLLATFLYFMQNRWWFRAAIVAGIASACRSQGVLFGPVLAITYLLRSNLMPQWRRFPIALLLLLISLLGLLCYMDYLSWKFDDAFAFIYAQRWWFAGIDSAHINYALNPVNGLTNLFYQTVQHPLDWPRTWEALCVVAPPVLIMLLGARFLSFELELLAWLLWGLPYVSNCVPNLDEQLRHAGDWSHWMSMGRFMAVALPLQIIFGAVVVRFRWVGAVLAATSGALFAIFSFLYGAGMWVG